jgi:glutaredoxin
MMSSSRSCLVGAFARAVLGAALVVLALPGQAQYKVIGGDGKVTYTDREPSASEGKVIALGGRGVVAQTAEPDLPFELRQAANKYPVTLYVTTTACEPCVSARRFLKERGIPFNERLVVTAEDSEALERLSGAREAPTLTIGSQTLRGLASDVWTSYLDAAGYPRESRLPAGYQYRPATPIVEQQPRPPTTARADARAAPSAPAAPAPQGPGGIRF